MNGGMDSWMKSMCELKRIERFGLHVESSDSREAEREGFSLGFDSNARGRL